MVLGHEQFGVSEAVLRQCDTSVKIPMAHGVDSFNVGCAAAIMLHEAFRQRTPLRRLGTAEDVANAVVFLASEEASFITGEIMDVNGGLYID